MNSIVVYLLIGVATALLVFFAYLYYFQDQTKKKLINRRLRLLDAHEDRAEVLEILRRERAINFSDGVRFRVVQDFLIQSGLRLGNTSLAIYSATMACVVTVLIAFLMGSCLVAISLGVVCSLIAMATAVKIARERRIAKFNGQFAEVLEIIVRSLRAGHPLPISLALVAREMPDPVGTEFGILSDEINYGLEIPSALNNLFRRVGDPDLKFFITAISIQTQTGGNLAELLARLARMIHDREKLRRKVTSLTAEGRMSSTFLSLLPVFLFFVINALSPDYFGGVWNEPGFRKSMAIAGCLLVIGNFMMRRLTKLRY